jgi:predicted RNase H-like HicB family nuclease
MKILKAILSKGPDDFGAWFENMDGVYGAGDTVAEAKKNLLDGLALYAKHNATAPAWIKNKAYRIVYKFDAESILNYYRGIFTNAALERITGINQRQIQHYASGTKRPRPRQLKKIENAFHELGQELISVEL